MSRSPPAGFVVANIQALRGIAALVVVFLHGVGFGQNWRPDDPILDTLKPIAEVVGFAGVDLFFVISGFVITLVALRDAGRATSWFSARLAGGFAVRRIVRIYPLYWLTTIATMALAGASLLLVLERPWAILLAAQPGQMNPVAWTLVFEMYFYAGMTLLLLVAARRLRLALAAWGVVQAALVAWHPPGIIGSALTLEFAFGCAIALMVSHGVRVAPRIALATGSAALVAAFAVGIAAGPTAYVAFRALYYGVPVALILYGLVVVELADGWRLPAWLQSCGEYSYSLYLWHFPVLLAWGWLWTLVRADRFAPAVLWSCLGIAAVIGVARLSYRWIERPMIELGHGLPRPAPAT